MKLFYRNLIYLGAALILLMLQISSAWAGQMHDLRNQRYCEILTSIDEWFTRNITVYNTIGLNDCPTDLWQKITPEAIKQQTKSSFVRLNGPRYWTIDGLKNSKLVEPKITVLGGIPMRKAGILQINLMDVLSSRRPYTKHPVKRNTTWIYKAGKPIYELINPEGEIFVMQSYSIEKTPQDEASLAALAAHLKLPQGWNFRTRTLSNDACLTPIKQKAIVIQDDFLNTYQQETPGFEKNTSHQ